MRKRKLPLIYERIFPLKRCNLEKIESYYKKKRLEKYQASVLPCLGIRRFLHQPIIFGVKLRHKICKRHCRLIYNKYENHGRPVIFAATHICWDDIEYIFDAITVHAWLFWGDPGELYCQFDGAILDLNGCVIVDTHDKQDRFIAKETAIKLLLQGENLLIFPEGVWNTSENQLVQYLFPGIAEMAIRSGAEIVPVAIERSEVGFDIAIGRPMDPRNYALDQKWQLLQEIRDAMATCKWDVLEASGVHSRQEIPEGFSETFKEAILKDGRGLYTWSDFKEQSFHPRGITNPEDVFPTFQ